MTYHGSTPRSDPQHACRVLGPLSPNRLLFVHPMDQEKKRIKTAVEGPGESRENRQSPDQHEKSFFTGLGKPIATRAPEPGFPLFPGPAETGVRFGVSVVPMVSQAEQRFSLPSQQTVSGVVCQFSVLDRSLPSKKPPHLDR